MLKKYTLFVLIAAAPALAWGGAARAEMLSPDDTRVAKAAIKAVKDGKWAKVRRFASTIDDPLATKIIAWMYFTRQGSGATFSQIAGFLSRNPDWPSQDRLRIRAEEAIKPGMADNEILSWFKERPPLGAEGRMRHGAALLASGEKELGRQVLRQGWIEGNFTKRRENIFYKRHRKLLTRGDHRKRLDRLLWEGRYWPSRRMLWRVDARYRALGEARLLLRHRQGNVDKAIARVADDLKGHPGLVYERLRWRRRKGKDASAIELLADQPAKPDHPELWWTERATLARRALLKGHVSEAYDIARNHRQSGGSGFADAEWTAGWIALRFLGDQKVAKNHFVTMFEAVNYPLSRARGAYWAARAAEAMKESDVAGLWYRTAAGLPTTYYGQLAAARLKPGRTLRLPADPQPSPEEEAAFSSHELVRVVRMLGELAEHEHMRPFLLALSAVHDTPGWQALSALLARRNGRPDAAIAVAKKSSRQGHQLIGGGYPALIPPLIKDSDGKSAVEVPLILAMIRQESAFYTKAKSHAGAQGLMQLLPRTARKQAKKLKMPYSPTRLLSDADYNLKLGQAYLFGLIGDFKGSYILSLAAYNAGPSRARRWVRNNGDPRDDTVDAIDWIEMIPFDETRNYIQRVLENLQVYRLRLADTEVALTLEGDLRR